MKPVPIQLVSSPRSARIAQEFVAILLLILIPLSITASHAEEPAEAVVEEAVEETVEDESFTSIAKSYFEKAVGAAKGLFKDEEIEEEGTPAVDPDEVALEAALAEAKGAILHSEGGSHFTQSRWGATPTPYQIEGLELTPLAEGTLNESDASVGIDRRLTYEFSAANWRKFHPQAGWGRWTKGVPPHLESLTLVRQNGLWKVSVSPLWAYSLK